MECFNCGGEGCLEKHHVVPRSLGGIKTVYLCSKCHGLAHGNALLRNDNHAVLIKKGIERRRNEGAVWGRPSNGYDAKIILRLTESEKRGIISFSKSKGISLSEFIRMALRDKFYPT